MAKTKRKQAPPTYEVFHIPRGVIIRCKHCRFGISVPPGYILTQNAARADMRTRDVRCLFCKAPAPVPRIYRTRPLAEIAKITAERFGIPKGDLERLDAAMPNRLRAILRRE